MDRSLTVAGLVREVATTNQHPIEAPDMQAPLVQAPPIRHVVSQALYLRRLTPDMEQTINAEMSRMGYITDADFEALELLMEEMDAGRIHVVASPSFF
jgi:hypothetical protein